MVLKLETAKQAIDLHERLAAVRLKISRWQDADTVLLRCGVRRGHHDTVLENSPADAPMAADVVAVVLRHLRLREAAIIREMHKINMEIPE